jgi:hypothetical protein
MGIHSLYITTLNIYVKMSCGVVVSCEVEQFCKKYHDACVSDIVSLFGTGHFLFDELIDRSPLGLGPTPCNLRKKAPSLLRPGPLIFLNQLLKTRVYKWRSFLSQFLKNSLAGLP